MGGSDSKNVGTFEVFAFSWSLVLLVGLSTLSMTSSPLRVLLCLVAALAVALARSPPALMAASAAFLIHYAVDDYRHPYVHLYLYAYIAWLVLLVGGLAFDRSAERWRERFVQLASTPAVVLAGICFFAAGFAKLNTSFTDPELSCATVFYSYQHTVPPYSWLPQADWMHHFAIWLTITVELCAPVLWIWPRTRKIGVALGFLFFWLLATNPISRFHGFVSPFAALLVLGFDWRPVLASWSARVTLPAWSRWVAVGVFWVGVAVLAVFAEQGDALLWRHRVFRTGTLVLFLVFLGSLPWLAVLPFASAESRSFPRAVLALVWLLPVVVGLQEARPYFAMPTRNFTMAGNFILTTEYSNHLLVRSPLPFPGRDSLEKNWGVKVRHLGPTPAFCHKRRSGESRKAYDKRTRQLKKRFFSARKKQ